MAGGCSTGSTTGTGPGINGQVYAEALATGALISGRRTFELAGGWGGDHHDGVPIHVLTHHPDDATRRRRTGRRSTPTSPPARPTPGPRPATARSWCTARAPPRRCSRAGELDELEIHLVPVLLGAGRRLFEDTDRVELERVRQLEGRDVTHLRYRVVR